MLRSMATFRRPGSRGGLRGGGVGRRGGRIGGRAGSVKVPPKMVAAGVSTRPTDAASRQAAKLTAEQLVAEIGRRELLSLGNNYAIAMALRELAKPVRYHDELKFET